MISNEDERLLETQYSDIERILNQATEVTDSRGETQQTSLILKAEQRLDKLIPISEDNKVSHALLKIWILSLLNQPNSALTTFNDIINKKNKFQNRLKLLTRSIGALNNALWRQDKLSEAIAVIEKGETALKSIEGRDNDVLDSFAKLVQKKGKCYWQKGDFDNAFDCYQKSVEIQRDLGNTAELAVALNFLGLIHLEKGNLDSSLEYHQKSLELYQEVGNRKNTPIIFCNIGIIYSRKGDLDSALDYHQKSLALWEELEDNFGIAMSQSNVGEIYRAKGELNKALKCYQRSLAIAEEHSVNKRELAIFYENIGAIYFIKGDLDLALEYYQKSMNLRRKLDHKPLIANSFDIIGRVHQSKGNFHESYDYFSKALTLKEQIGNIHEIAVTLYNLVILTVEHDRIEEAKIFLKQLENIDEKEENKVINQRFRLSKALILKKSKRISNKSKAQEMFYDIAHEEIMQHEITVFAMLNLSELLLFELTLMEGEKAILEELKELINKLLDITRKQHSHSLLIRTHLLQSKIALLELDVKLADLLLTQARTNADEKGLWRLSILVSNEADSLHLQLSKWEELKQRNASILERMEIAQVDRIIKQMIQKQVEDIRTLPQIAVEYIKVSLFKISSGGTVLSVSEPLHYTEDDANVLNKMGLFYTISLGQGQSVEINKGLFGPLPIPDIPNYVSIVYSFSIKDPEYTDPHCKGITYAIMVFSMSREFLHFFRDRTRICDIIEETMGGISFIDQIDLGFLQSLKHQIVKIEPK